MTYALVILSTHWSHILILVTASFTKVQRHLFRLKQGPLNLTQNIALSALQSDASGCQ